MGTSGIQPSAYTPPPELTQTGGEPVKSEPSAYALPAGLTQTKTEPVKSEPSAYALPAGLTQTKTEPVKSEPSAYALPAGLTKTGGAPSGAGMEKPQVAKPAPDEMSLEEKADLQMNALVVNDAKEKEDIVLAEIGETEVSQTEAMSDEEKQTIVDTLKQWAATSETIDPKLKKQILNGEFDGNFTDGSLSDDKIRGVLADIVKSEIAGKGQSLNDGNNEFLKFAVQAAFVGGDITEQAQMALVAARSAAGLTGDGGRNDVAFETLAAQNEE